MPDLRYITLTGTCLRGAGPTPAVGYVQLASVRMVQAPGADVMVTTQPSSAVALDQNGKFAVQVVDGMDASLAATLLVEVRFLLEDTRPEVRVYSVTTDLDTIDISDCVQVPSVPNRGEYVNAVPWDVVGRPGGVAPIGDGGRIPAQYLPPASGGLSAYHHEQNTADDAWQVPHSLGYRPVFSFQDTMGRQIGGGYYLEHALDLMSTTVRWPVPVSGTADCS
jgi:hypothetical protein